MNSDITILGIALGVGLLVGLQRERMDSKIAGIRTFSLIAVFGALCGLLSKEFGQYWIIITGMLAIATFMVVANFMKREIEDYDIGQTTEIAAILMFIVGVYLAVGDLVVGVVVSAVVALLLYLKKFFTEYVSRLGEKDLQAIMVFVAVSLVVLPILPNKTFGPYDVLNPREIWLMVVLIVGISIAGYFAYKWLGKKVGTGLSGVLGGLISSTATTVTYSRQSKEHASSQYLPAFIIIAASAVSFLRVILEIAVVAPSFVTTVIPPILLVGVFLAALSVFYFFKSNQDEQEDTPDPDNPAQFRTALVFAILYALILLGLAFVKDYFGEGGLYAMSFMSGLTDMDAITLSLANTMNSGNIIASSGWRYILLAALSNLIFKGGMVIFLGHRDLIKKVIPAFLMTIVLGVVVMIFW